MASLKREEQESGSVGTTCFHDRKVMASLKLKDAFEFHEIRWCFHDRKVMASLKLCVDLLFIYE